VLRFTVGGVGAVVWCSVGGVVLRCSVGGVGAAVFCVTLYCTEIRPPIRCSWLWDAGTSSLAVFCVICVVLWWCGCCCVVLVVWVLLCSV
jgi:hypothetical protein